MSSDIKEQNANKAAIVALISLKREATIKSSKEIQNEIRKALEESLARIQWIALEKIIVVEEKMQDVFTGKKL